MLQLKKFHDIPVSTREEARESRPHPEEPHFRLLAREEVSFPSCSERIPGVLIASQEEVFSTGKVRGTPGSGHHSQSPPDVSLSPFQGNLFSLHCLDFQAEDRLTPRWRVGQPFGKATWECLMGKPRGKDTDPLIHANGSVTLLLQLGRKVHVHTSTRDED